MEKTPSVRPLNSHIRSLSDQFPVYLPTTTNRPTGPHCYGFTAGAPADAEDESCSHTSTNYEASAETVVSTLNRNEALGENEEGEGCHSLETVNLDITDESIYYNLRRATRLLNKEDQLTPEEDLSERIYADVTDPSNPQMEPSSHIQPVPERPPLALPRSISNPGPRLLYQRQPPVKNYFQPGSSTQHMQTVDVMKEMEEVISSSITSEAPGNFKQRLAKIIAKDLARVQPHSPFSASSPTSSE